MLVRIVLCVAFMCLIGLNVQAIELDYRNVEVTEFAEALGKLLDKNIVYDDSVKGKITVVTPSSVTEFEAYEAMVAGISAAGFSVVDEGSILRIVKSTKDALPPVKRPNIRTVGAITRIITLKNLVPSDIATSLVAPLLDKNAFVAAHDISQSIIVKGDSKSIRHIEDVIEELDNSDYSDKISIIRLDYASAGEVADVCSKIFSTGKKKVVRIGRNQATPDDAGLIVVPYERNDIIILAGNEDEIIRAERLINELDANPRPEASDVHIIALQNAEAESLAKTLNEVVSARPAVKNKAGRITLVAEKSTNTLIVTASRDEFEALVPIIESLDVKRRQVFVEALILEVSMDTIEKMGLSLQGGADTSNGVVFTGSNLNTGNATLGDLATVGNSSVPSLLTKTLSGMLLGGVFNPVSVEGPDGQLISVPAFSLMLDLSKRSGDVDILSAPRLLTTDNEEAEVVIGQNVPIITNRLTDAGGSGLAQSVSVERQDVALTLRFTPQITEGDLVRLNVFQEITEIAPTNPNVGTVDNVGPTLTKRLLRNTVVVNDGATVALGGLYSKTKVSEKHKVPLLGDIPLLGRLFRSEKNSERKTCLLIMLTPRVIRDAQDLADLTVTYREKLGFTDKDFDLEGPKDN